MRNFAKLRSAAEIREFLRSGRFCAMFRGDYPA